MDDAIDLKDLLERVQDDWDLLLELLDIFWEDFGTKRKSLEEAIRSKNIDEVCSLAHSIKGASGNISAKKVQATCLAIEQKAKLNDLSGLDSLLKLLDQQAIDLKANIEKLKQQKSP